MWGLSPPHPFSKKRHIGRSAEWAGMLPFQRRRTMLISTREPTLAILLDTCLWTLPTSLFFSSPNTIYWRMLHCPAAKPGVATGLRERGLLSTAQVQCGKNGGFDVFLLGYIYLYILLLCYIAICLYIYIGIVLFIYCIFGHIRYSIFKRTVISLGSLLWLE